MADESTARSTLESGFSASSSLTASNVGFRLLQKAGWREGSGLGVAEQGRLEPVDVLIKNDKRGIGSKVISQKMATGLRGSPEMLKVKGTESNGKRVISKKALRKLKKESEAERKLQEQLLQRKLQLVHNLHYKEFARLVYIYAHGGVKRETQEGMQWLAGGLKQGFTIFGIRRPGGACYHLLDDNHSRDAILDVDHSRGRCSFMLAQLDTNNAKNSIRKTKAK
ncbi:hypothetical protein GOP47_0027578 [Adiantum capillus-veneris]|nr:hypothetical protein GOP47_0027578 [Adiantum capillus-veneris]